MMNWREKVIKFNDKKDLEAMLRIGRIIENSLPRVNYNTEVQFNNDLRYKHDYIYRKILEEYKK